jgi:quercetin dioxygenase-like cupin family protein
MTLREPAEVGRDTAPAAIAGLVAYQEGSIVSRIVAKTAGGSLTVFAFDEGQSLSEHTVPHRAVLVVLEGTAEVTVGGSRCRVHAGQVIELPENVPHAVEAPTRFKMSLTMLRH